ncbi:NAD(P)H-dependent flavin oxidoreductase [Paremcibacter congregatus]|uniref:Nitronate monooxygenase n=1 Tax=Paremcibacter congregatus TaxID=2043170 RepID=A0A2G4YPD4_9PROT|nr:nitronate monooxygenase [Paremcibacter congregatus]PHZ84184.1 nitronate monooxygenase [Paremcibacter congregatus]QDE29082.1 nitronate monooxygenase [Paremcibacter congregatus]
MSLLKPMMMSGKEVLPLVEGGKGISATNGISAGAWAAAGGVGTVSCVNADSYDDQGNIIPQVYHGKTRIERHQELVDYGVDGGITQVQQAHEVSGGEGRIHINVLWEMGGAEAVLEGVLAKTKGLVHGVTCGAGMPYKLSEIAAKHEVFYHPIISSARAFGILWKRAYKKYGNWLGSVVYEDPWLAGGHNGLSNAEDPRDPQDPYPRVAALRTMMNKFGLQHVPIIMAGGVWYLRDWAKWLNNPEIGLISFQFGTRPLLTQESPIPQIWKDALTKLSEGDILLHRFSPTGFYSSAVRNKFLRNLEARSERQVAFQAKPCEAFSAEIQAGKRKYFVQPEDKPKVEAWISAGYCEGMKTPDGTLVFVKPTEALEIRKDQKDCMGCLSQCKFSNWADNPETKYSTGRGADPRSFCIQKTLMDIAHGGALEDNLMFAGHSAANFSTDPFFSNGFVPTVKQLVDRILTGD